MTRRLTIKKEIRTLGLDLCNPGLLLGVVVRGSSYLDGVLVLPVEPMPTDASIASTILRTRFFPELRMIMAHDPEGRLDPKAIERMTKLPVIQVDSARKRRSGVFSSYTVGSRKLQARSILPSETLQEIFATTWAIGTMPEPLRVAHLLSRSRILAKNTRF